MKNSLVLAVISLAFLGLGACATSSLPTTEELSPTETEGLLLFSISQQGWKIAEITVSFRDSDGNNVRRVKTADGILGPAWKENNGFDFLLSGGGGHLFALRLPPGEYEIHRWSVSTGVASYYPSSDFSLPFSIKRGKSTYMGDFNFTMGKGHNLFGIPIQFLDDIAYLNSWERDLNALRSKYPSMNLLEVDFSGLEFGVDLEGADGPDRAVNMPPYVAPVVR
ncbi:MAG: hypothetical protein CML99_09850 [Rhodobiaceae bacterium]|nr:hypothetical protein [Rhodobiaceae bacterium]|tara:strand:+ start:416 stop:1084 length:669 start_codon:yes stop_codon:yes gene_type:complete